jgi:hypothetical protein
LQTKTILIAANILKITLRANIKLCRFE